MTIRSAFTLAVLAAAAASHAVLGGQIFVQNTGNVTLTFLGSSTGLLDVLNLDSPSNVSGIFANFLSSPGDTYNLGTITGGSELVFRLDEIFFSNSYYTGPSSRNADGVIHANVVANGTGVDVFFEDDLGGGDRDYNDFGFHVSNAALTPLASVPGPTAIIPFTMGALATLRRRRAKRA